MVELNSGRRATAGCIVETGGETGKSQDTTTLSTTCGDEMAGPLSEVVREYPQLEGLIERLGFEDIDELISFLSEDGSRQIVKSECHTLSDLDDLYTAVSKIKGKMATEAEWALRSIGMEYLIPKLASPFSNLSSLYTLSHDDSMMKELGLSVSDRYKLRRRVSTLSRQEREESPKKRVFLPIHGLIPLPRWIWESIVDTSHFQRLKGLRQIGACSQVFPGGTHTRFEHSLGVAHLGHQMFSHLASTTEGVSTVDPEVMMYNKCVVLAGLCHDIGHGPFSHTFEHFMNVDNPQNILGKWSHEEMSVQILDDLYETSDTLPEHLPREYLSIVKQMILGRDPSDMGRQGGCPYEDLFRASYDIVASKRNGIDVDRFDYLQRDSSSIGVPVQFEPSRLIEFSRVVDGEICFNLKEQQQIWDMCYARYSLFKRVYTHRKVSAIEYMYCDALRLVDPIFGITESARDPKEFVRSPLFQDGVIQLIGGSSPSWLRKDDPCLTEAQKVMQRVHKRDIYRFADEEILVDMPRYHSLKSKVTAETIAANSSILRPEDIVVDWNKIHYGTDDTSPWDQVHFYQPHDKNAEIQTLNMDTRSMYASNFVEGQIRIYVKSNDKEKIDASAKALTRTLKEMGIERKGGVRGKTDVEGRN